MEFDPKMFPNLANIDVIKTSTKFDYNVWGSKTALYLKNIPALIGSDYSNTLKFNTIEERNAYFKSDSPIQLNTEYRIPHTGVLRLPIPYDTLINYNYLTASYPDAPVPDYNTLTSRKDYFYFIEDCSYINPNTTEVKIILDVWTSYIEDVNINNVILEQGHYPFTLNTVDEFLADPINHTNGLLTLDSNFGVTSLVKATNAIDFRENEKIVITSTVALYEYAEGFINPSDINEDGAIISAPGADYSLPSYSDKVYMLVVEQEDYLSLLEKIGEYEPSFLNKIKKIELVATKFLDMTRTEFYLNYHGVSYFAYPYVNFMTEYGTFYMPYKLTKYMFDYPEEYKELTKLYTSPYAMLEITDNISTPVKINIQEMTSNVGFSSNFVKDYPYSGVLTQLSGINGESRWVEQEGVVYLSGRDIGDTINWKFNTPTKPLYLPFATQYRQDTKYKRIQQIEDIKLEFANSKRSLNTAKTNSENSLANTISNTTANIATTLANATLDNTTTLNRSIRMNDMENKITVENVDNIGQTDPTAYYDDLESIANKEMALKQYITGREISSASYIMATHIQSNLEVSDATLRHNALTAELNAIQQHVAAELGTSGSVTSGAMSVAGAATAGLANPISMMVAAPALFTMGSDFLGKQTSWMVTKGLMETDLTNNYGSFSTNVRINGIGTPTEINLNTTHTQPFGVLLPVAPAIATISFNRNLGILNIAADAIQRSSNDLNAEKTYSENSVGTYISRLKYNATKLNYTAQSSTNVTNFTLNNTTATTINENNDLIETAIINNTYDKGMLSIVNTLGNSLESISNDLRQALVKAPIQISEYDDIETGFTSRSGLAYLKIQIKTQSKDAIKRVGDMFLRYGYTYNGNIDFTDFNLMENFTYWKMSDVWLTSNIVNNSAIKTIKAILMNGTTVWSDPLTAGNTTIYNNKQKGI